MQPVLSVIIPYKDDPRLRSVLAALWPQASATPWVEIIVVDDGSETPPDEFVAGKARIVRSPKNLGSYAARNIGVKHARAQNLGFLDSDTIPGQDWVRNGLDALQNSLGPAHPNGAMFGGPVRVYAECNHPSPTENLSLATAFPMEHYALVKGFIGAGNMFIRKDTFEEVGWFDASLTGSGDKEFGERAKRKGVHIVYNSNIEVHHRAYGWSRVKAKARRLVDNHLQRVSIEARPLRKLAWILDQVPGPYTHYKILRHGALGPRDRIGAIGALWAKQAYRMYYQAKCLRARQPKKTRWMLPGEAYKWIWENIPERARVIELGSGFGSAHLATRYRVTSIEHDADWVDLFPNVAYIHAPIKNGWYDTKPLEEIPMPGKEGGIVVIDGPPSFVGRRGIMQKLEVMEQFIGYGSILVDDTHRWGEAHLAWWISDRYGLDKREFKTSDGRGFVVLTASKGHPVDNQDAGALSDHWFTGMDEVAHEA